MTISDTTFIEASTASATIGAVSHAVPGKSHGRFSRRRDASLLLSGLLLGVGVSWVVARGIAIYPRAVDRVASEIRLEVAKNHPELLKDVTPFIECAVLRQKANGSLFEHLADRSLLMPNFRSDVAFCAKAADELLAKMPKISDPNSQTADLAVPPIALVPVVPLPEINSSPAGTLSAMPALSPSFRPPPQIAPPLVTVAPGDQLPTAAGTNGIPSVFTAEPVGTFGPVVPPMSDLGGLIQQPPIQSPLQVVKPPENH